MTTVNSGKMKDAEKAALQSEIAFYSNLIAQHDELLKAKQQSCVTNCTSFADKPHSSNAKISSQTNNEVTKSNHHIHPSLKLMSRHLTNSLPKSSSSVRNVNFDNGTVVINKIASPVPKTSLSSFKKLSFKPNVQNTVSSWNSSHKHTNHYRKGAVVYGATINNSRNLLSLSNVSRLQSQISSLKVDKTASLSNVKLEHSAEHVDKNSKCSGFQTKSLSEKNFAKSDSGSLFGEILAITEKLKQASKTLSSSNSEKSGVALCKQRLKICAKLDSFSNPAKVCVQSKSMLANVPAQKNTFSAAIVSPHKLKTDNGNIQKNGSQPVHTLNTPPSMTYSTSYSSCSENKEQDIVSACLSFQSKKNFNILSDKLLLSKKVIESRPNGFTKHVKRLKNTPTIAKKVVKSPVNSNKRKSAVTKLNPSKYKVVNKKSPCLYTVTIGTTALPKNVNNACTSQFKNNKWTCQKETEQRPFGIKAKLLNSKYKVINKNCDSSCNLKKNPLEFSSTKILKRSKPYISRKRMSDFKYVNKSKILNINTSMISIPLNSKPVAAILKPSTKLFSKTNNVDNLMNKSFKTQVSLRKHKIHTLNLASKSKYKVVNKTSINSPNRVSKNVKSSPKKLFHFPASNIDVDLLMELAAERNSCSSNIQTPQNKLVLLKRVYKSKNTIINKNICSAQVKTAKMIKSKYLAGNKRHSWHKQAVSRRFPNLKRFQGGLSTSFQAKISSTPFYNRRIERNQFKHKIRNYTNASTYFSQRNSKRMLFPQNKFSFGVNKTSRKIIRNRSMCMKASNVGKLQTPLSKTLASRVLQHSINTVLTASVKKKMSKVNTYCMFYNRFGRCNKGVKCPFVHDPSKIAICTRFLRGTCKVENCPFSHEICPGKMAICSFYLLGSCTKTNCPYRHEMLIPGVELCKAFVQGYCPNGKQCKKAHILVCPKYVQGCCDKGDACAFPHPPPKEKKVIEKTAEKCEHLNSDEFLMERVSRYFQPLNEEQSSKNQASVVPKRQNLPEQPSFISLSFTGCDS